MLVRHPSPPLEPEFKQVNRHLLTESPASHLLVNLVDNLSMALKSSLGQWLFTLEVIYSRRVLLTGCPIQGGINDVDSYIPALFTISGLSGSSGE